MKQCARCGQQLNDNEQFCNRCGGTNFKTMGTQGQNARPMGAQQQRPMPGNAGVNNAQQRPMQGQPQQVRQNQPSRPNQPNRPMQGQQAGMQQNNNFNNGMVQQQNNQFSDAPVMKLRKMSKKEKQSKEMELMYAMKAASERGEYFDEEMFKQQHGWYEDGSNSAESSGDMTVGDWLKTLLIMLIPIANIVIAFLGMRNTSNPLYKRNYYKAFMIYYLVAFVVSTLIALLL